MAPSARSLNPTTILTTRFAWSNVFDAMVIALADQHGTARRLKRQTEPRLNTEHVVCRVTSAPIVESLTLRRGRPAAG